MYLIKKNIQKNLLLNIYCYFISSILISLILVLYIKSKGIYKLTI